MTLEALSTVQAGTRVLLADGRYGQFRMTLMPSRMAVVYVFDMREYRQVDPRHLEDLRGTQGELVEVKEVPMEAGV